MPAHISEGGSSLFSPLIQGFPGGSDGKEFAWNAGDLGLVPGLGKFPGVCTLQGTVSTDTQH